MTRIIVLAAGRGMRMNSELTKVLVPLKNKPMIQHLIDSIVESGLDSRPIVVVSPDNKKAIRQALKDYKIDYVVQKEQLGTGHAVSCTSKLLTKDFDNILVLYGDQPFLQSSSLQKVAQLSPKPLVMLTTKLPDFNSWHRNFYYLGRIIRDKNSNIEKIVEFKDASEEEKLVTEINPAVMCFGREWLLKSLAQLSNKNNQQEYYLTDLVQIAFDEGSIIDSLTIKPSEAVGINSLEELQIAEDLL